jgi:hypothetical protein
MLSIDAFDRSHCLASGQLDSDWKSPIDVLVVCRDLQLRHSVNVLNCTSSSQLTCIDDHSSITNHRHATFDIQMSSYCKDVEWICNDSNQTNVTLINRYICLFPLSTSNRSIVFIGSYWIDWCLFHSIWIFSSNRMRLKDKEETRRSQVRPCWTW